MPNKNSRQAGRKNTHRKQYVKEFLLMVIIITGLFMAILSVRQSQNIRPEASSSLVDYSFVPEKVSASVGDEILLTLFIIPHDNSVTAMDIPLHFNSDEFEVVELTTTDLFRDIVFGPEIVDNGAWVSVASVPSGVSEAGEVLRIKVRALKQVENGLVTVNRDSANVAVLGMHSTNMVGDIFPAIVDISE